MSQYPGVGWADGPNGGTPLDAANLEVMDQGIADEDLRNPASPASLAAAALYGHDVRAWAPNTPYIAGQAVVSPTTGDVVTAKTNHTSSTTYSGTGAGGNWNLSAASTLAATAVPKWQPNTVYAAGAQVASPSNDVVSAAMAHTSGATYSGLVSAGGNWIASTTFAPTALPGGWAGGVKGTRRAEFTFAGGGNSQFNGNLVDTHQRLLFKIPVATTRWRLRIGNNMPDGTLTSGAISVTGVYLGTPVVDSTGAPTGAFTAAPTSVIAPFSTNADGSDLRTAWITDPTLQIAANTLAGLSIGWTATAGQVIQNGGAKMWYSTGTGKNADAAAAAPTLSTAQTTAFNIAIEYEFAGVNQVGLVIGDSLTDGYFTSATLLALDTYHQHYSQRTGIPIITTADYGSNSNEWTTYTQERWQRLIASGHTIDFAVVDIGSNDANNAATLTAFQGYVASIVANIRSLGINRIYFNTVAPRALTGTNETNRVAYNTWLASRPFGIRAVFDVDALLSDPATPANLRSGYAGSDTVHWSPYAHFRASLAWAPIG